MTNAAHTRLLGAFCLTALAVSGMAKLPSTAQADNIPRATLLYAAKNPAEQRLSSQEALQQSASAHPGNAVVGTVHAPVGDYISIHRRLAP